MKTYKLLLLLLLSPVVTACGQPGPLYLPGTPAPIHTDPQPEPAKDK